MAIGFGLCGGNPFGLCGGNPFSSSMRKADQDLWLDVFSKKDKQRKKKYKDTAEN